MFLCILPPQAQERHDLLAHQHRELQAAYDRRPPRDQDVQRIQELEQMINDMHDHIR